MKSSACSHSSTIFKQMPAGLALYSARFVSPVPDAATENEKL